MKHGGTTLAVSPTLMVCIVLVGQMGGMVWFGLLNNQVSLKFAEMKLRFRNQHNNQWS